MSNRRRRTESEWRGLLSSFEQSGMTRDRFCRQESLSLSTFESWRSKMRSTPTSAPKPLPARFVEICLPPAEESATARSASTEAQIPEVVVELPFGVTLRFRGMTK